LPLIGGPPSLLRHEKSIPGFRHILATVVKLLSSGGAKVLVFENILSMANHKFTTYRTETQYGPLESVFHIGVYNRC
jgi:hypothetical protein